MSGSLRAGVVPLFVNSDAAAINMLDSEDSFISSDNTKQWKTVMLNPEVITGAGLSVGDNLSFALFDKSYFATTDRIVTNIAGTVTIRARLDEYDYGYVLISTSGEKSEGVIRIPENREHYRIQPTQEEPFSVLQEMDELKVDDILLLGPLIPPPDYDSPEIMRLRQTVDDSSTLSMEIVQVDVMVVYTESARVGAGGTDSMNNLIAQAMEKGQMTLENSETLMSIHLVHSGQVDYEESGDTAVDLRRLTASSTFNPWYPDHDGYIEIVHEWRDQYSADLAALFTEEGDSRGRAWALTRKSGRPDYGFSITRRNAASGFTFIHELGHNMGAHHHKEQNFSPGPTDWSDWPENDWSAGWRWTGNDSQRYCTVMTYTSGTYFPDGLNHSRVAYFSNPNILYEGIPTGHPTDGDNARTLREIRHVIAAYRNGYDFIYTFDNGKATITGYTGDGGDITIPDTLGGHTVTAIGAHAFWKCTSLTSVTILDSVNSIGYAAFAYSTNMTRLVIGNSVATIEDYAFFDCSRLTRVYFTGNPALLGDWVFHDAPSTIYYLPNSSGWGDTYADRPAALWNPTFTAPELVAGAFSTSVTGTPDIPVAVEVRACLLTGEWIPLLTTTIPSSGILEFNDPNAVNHPARFYRIVGP